MGGVDNSIRLLLAPPGGDFVQVCTLTGHGNWVRSLAFSTTSGQPGENFHRMDFKQTLSSCNVEARYTQMW